MKDISHVSKGISAYTFGDGSFFQLNEFLVNKNEKDYFLCIIDAFFIGTEFYQYLETIPFLQVRIYDPIHEPSTDDMDTIVIETRQRYQTDPSVIIGIGGGCTLDVAKAVSNLFANGGKAEDYQGWDLLKKPGIYKIGIPSISGTGAEASRTCVLLSKRKNLKLGMNSEYSLFDFLILDPELTVTVPRDQYFFTGMDTYIHCIESLNGNHRHPIADSYSHEALRLCREVFTSDNMQSEENRTKLMTASFLGGSAIANSYVGVVHPISAALSVLFDSRHCVTNCMVMQYMGEFYPKESEEFLSMVNKQKIVIPSLDKSYYRSENLDSEDLTDELCDRLYQLAIVHKKPLQNALGENYKKILSPSKVRDLFGRILR